MQCSVESAIWWDGAISVSPGNPYQDPGLDLDTAAAIFTKVVKSTGHWASLHEVLQSE